MKASAELADIPNTELVGLLDFMVWEMSHNGRSDVMLWRNELLAHEDAKTEWVIRAIAVCDN